MSLRHARNKQDDEDASQLKFGPEFSGDVQKGCLTISEVKILLEQLGKKSDNAVFTESGLADFEQVQIVNLCPATSEEAKALIPSLAERDDDILQQFLNQIAALRKFQ
ncbi:RNA polymerase B [Microbotryomycetes sp. JL221]|nr:RNA polymerase B [Microbotryomycetes sp. JL221]